MIYPIVFTLAILISVFLVIRLIFNNTNDTILNKLLISIGCKKLKISL